jgi:hypothetical protein
MLGEKSFAPFSIARVIVFGFVVGHIHQPRRWTLLVQAQALRQVALWLRLQATILAYRDALLLITGLIVVAFVLAFFVGNPRAEHAGAEIME